jgi:predicted RND superfamily exporter protein
LAKIKKIAQITLLVVLIISALLAYKTASIGFDYDFEAFFSKDDIETEYFETHRRKFSTDNDFIFISLKNEPSIFDQKFLEKVNDFISDVEKDSLVEQVGCLTKMEEYVKTPFSSAVISRPYIHVSNPKKYEKDSIRISKHPEITNFLVDKNYTSLLVKINHRQFMSKEKCDTLKMSIDVLLDKYEFTDYKYAGRAIGGGYIISKMQRETGLFIGLSLILVVIFLIITFRSWWGLWLPLLIVVMSMVWIIGFMSLVNEPLNLILTILPTIIFVVAMSDVMHLVSKFLEELRNGKDKTAAVKVAYREVGMATLLTSVTTAIGFLTLLTIDMGPVRTFGIYTAIGVMLAFILAYTLLPSLLVLVKPPKVSTKKNDETIWYKILHKTLGFVIKKRKTVAISFLGLVILSAYGSTLVIPDYFLLEDLVKDDQLRQDYEYFDNEFMGLRPFELGVEVKDTSKSILDYEVLSEMNKMETFLTEEYGLKQCFSIITVLKIANRTEHGGQLKYFKFPTEEETETYLNRIEKFDRQGMLAQVVDSTRQFGRITSSMGDIGMLSVRKKNKAYEKFKSEEINTDIVDFRLTGTAHLLDKNMSNLSRSLFLGLGLAVGIVSLIMGLIYRSFRIILIALIPNILPLLMLGALLGFAGVELKVSTAVVFTISFGIAVDDTIHFMSKLKLELSKGKSLMVAIKRTFLSTGRAIVLTTIILVAGFLMLLFSSFNSTFYLGLLISCTLIFALISDLLFLPVLLILFYRPGKKIVKSQ